MNDASGLHIFEKIEREKNLHYFKNGPLLLTKNPLLQCLGRIPHIFIAVNLPPLMYTSAEIRPWPYDQGLLTIGFPQYDLIQPLLLRGDRLTSHDINDSYKYN